MFALVHSFSLSHTHTHTHTHTHEPFHWPFSGDSRPQVWSFYLVCIALFIRVQSGTQEPPKATQMERGYRARHSVYELFARQQFGSLKNKTTKHAVTMCPGNYTLGLNDNYGHKKVYMNHVHETCACSYPQTRNDPNILQWVRVGAA